MKIKHEHIESVLLAPQPKKGRRGSLTQLLKNICAVGRRIAPGTVQGLEQSAEYLSSLVER